MPPMPKSDVVSGSHELGPGAQQLRGLLAVGMSALVLVHRPGRRDVDLAGQLCVLGEDGHPVLRDRKEAAVQRDRYLVATRLLDPRREAFLELGEERGVAGQYADITVDC